MSEDVGNVEIATDDSLQARSFVAGANTTDMNNSTNGSINSTFGSRPNAWGSSDIWGVGPSNNLATTASTRDNSVSREVVQQPTTNASKPIEGKKGSGSLVESSVCDEYATRPWAGQRGSNSSRSIPQTRYTDNSLVQQRGMSNAGLPQSMMNMNTMSYPTRTPAANLTSTAPAQARPSFGSAYQPGTTGRGSENAPFKVYTKFDRQNDPMQRKPDSAVGGPWGEMSTTPSPSDERRPQFPIQFGNGRTPSMPTSRDGSDPPSRHSDQMPLFRDPQYTQPSQRETSNSSRAPSISSQRNDSFNYLQDEHLAMQLGQLNFNAESRPSTSNGPSFADAYSHASMGRGSVPFSGNGLSRSGSIEEVPRFSRNHSVHDDYSISQQHGFGNYSGSAHAGRFLQSGGAYEFHPGQPYQGNSVASRSYALSGGARRSPDYQNYPSSAQPTRRRSPGIDLQTYIDPRLVMDLQLRNQYGVPYNSLYGLQNAYQFQVNSPYANMMPLNMNMNMNMNMDPPSVTREPPAGEGVQSALMYEFKSLNKGKRYELRDIYDHIAEFSGDQHGSRFIQTKLETANSDEKDRVFQEIQPNAIQLMTDVFGNYVIQKFFEHGDQTHKKTLANRMRGHVLQLSLQMYGCRVVQKALDHVLVDQQAVLVGELANHVTKCVKDQNGNHVIQKAIELCPPATIEFIVAAFHGQVQQLSIHAYGCRVIQRCLERRDLPSKSMIMAELLEGIPTMISDQYGNYVVQHIVTHDDGEGRRRVLRTVAGNLEGYSKHKFASNVVETCIMRADDAWRRNVVYTLARAQQAPRRLDMPRESEGFLVNMIKDNFGNYVIRKLPSCSLRDIPVLTRPQKSSLMCCVARTTSSSWKFSTQRWLKQNDQVVASKSSPLRRRCIDSRSSSTAYLQVRM